MVICMQNLSYLVMDMFRFAKYKVINNALGDFPNGKRPAKESHSDIHIFGFN